MGVKGGRGGEGRGGEGRGGEGEVGGGIVALSFTNFFLVVIV